VSLPPIVSFRGPNFFLSNFYPCPVWFSNNDRGEVLYPSAEHAFQASKAWTIADWNYIRKATSAAEAKRRGNQITPIDIWEDVKVETMLNILRAKFSIRSPAGGGTNPRAVWLLETGSRELIEGNDWGDVFWGQCPLGNGKNMLGELLMQVRREIGGA